MKKKSGWVLVALMVLPVALVAAEAIRVAVTLRHRDARSLLARVSQELGPKGRISVDGERNQIVVEDEADFARKVARLIAELDQPARRFALGARLDIYPVPPKDPLFAKDPAFVDMTHMLARSKPERSYEALVNVAEGGSVTALLGGDYGLTVSAAGYDPSQRRLSLKSLQLWRGANASRRALLSGAATLPEGKATALVVGAEPDHPPLKLHLTPNLLPPVDGGGELPAQHRPNAREGR